MLKTDWVIQLDKLSCFILCRSNPSQPCIHNASVPVYFHSAAVLFVQDLKWWVSQRGADLSYILMPILLLYFNNWLSYTARQIFMLYFCCSNHYTYCTCGRFVDEIYVQDLKWWLCCTARQIFILYFCRSNPSLPCNHNTCVYNAFVLYLLSVTALQKDERCFPSAAVF